MRRATVRPGDRRHDREAQPRPPARARAVGTAKALERVRQELGREAHPAVAHVQLDGVGAALGRDPDLPPAMDEGVVDEVGHSPLEARGVSPRDQAVRLDHVQRAPGGVDTVALAGSGGGEDAAHLHGTRLHRQQRPCRPEPAGEGRRRGLRGDRSPRSPTRWPGAARPGTPRGAARARARPAGSRAGCEARGWHRQRRSARARSAVWIRSSMAFRVAPSRRELVVGGWDREALAGIRVGDLAGACPHRLHGTKRGGDREVRGQGGERERDRAADQEELAQALQRVIAVRERGADDGDEPVVLEADRRGEQAPRIAVKAGQAGSIDEHESSRRGGVDMGGVEHGPARLVPSVEQPPVRGQDLREAELAVAKHAQRRLAQAGVAHADRGGEGGRSFLEITVDALIEVRAQAVVDEEPVTARTSAISTVKTRVTRMRMGNALIRRRPLATCSRTREPSRCSDAEGPVDLVAQQPHVGVDDVRAILVLAVPGVLEQLVAGQHLPGRRMNTSRIASSFGESSTSPPRARPGASRGPAAGLRPRAAAARSPAPRRTRARRRARSSANENGFTR